MSNWKETTIFIFLASLIAVSWGEPDLMDALIACISGEPIQEIIRLRNE